MVDDISHTQMQLGVDSRHVAALVGQALLEEGSTCGWGQVCECCGERLQLAPSTVVGENVAVTSCFGFWS